MINPMSFHKPFYLLTVDKRNGKTELAELYLSRGRQRGRKKQLSRLGYGGPDSPYEIKTGLLSDFLPPLRGHPPENIHNVAVKLCLPPKLLFEVQREEEFLHKSMWERLKAKRDLLLGLGLIATAGFVTYEARRLRFFQDALHPVAILDIIILAYVLVSARRETRSLGAVILTGLIFIVLAMAAATLFEFLFAPIYR